MKTNNRIWKVKTLFERKEKINPQPEYQRGEVWNDSKRALLIDSILRDIDLPKFYLRKLISSMYTYEVTDGQQRLSAIFRFLENDLKLPKGELKGVQLGVYHGQDYSTRKFLDLPRNLQNTILDYQISIAVIEDALEDEIRTMFGRLQEGINLVPSEKRNSIISSIGKHIESIVLNHKFFESCKINSSRYKHHDYLAHTFALIFYNNSEDLKSDLLDKLYLNKTYKVSGKFLKKVTTVLDMMADIDSKYSYRIKNKYTFIDIFWFLYNQNGKKIQTDNFIGELQNLERNRLTYRKDIDKIYSNKSFTKKYKKLLSDYIIAYDRSGSTVLNIAKRSKVFEELFLKYMN